MHHLKKANDPMDQNNLLGGKIIHEAETFGTSIKKQIERIP